MTEYHDCHWTLMFLLFVVVVAGVKANTTHYFVHLLTNIGWMVLMYILFIHCVNEIKKSHAVKQAFIYIALITVPTKYESSQIVDGKNFVNDIAIYSMEEWVSMKKIICINKYLNFSSLSAFTLTYLHLSIDLRSLKGENKFRCIYLYLITSEGNNENT